MSTPRVSFVVPALDEAAMLPGLLASIQREAAAGGVDHEILVADNGSTDGTAAVARANGARVLDARGCTVGGARNFAVEASDGEILVFLDADMVLSPGWGVTLRALRSRLVGEGAPVLGGALDVPADGGWVARTWFGAARKATAGPVRYAGAAHLVLPRAAFEAQGGFDPALTTAEDYDLCARWRAAGTVILREPRLVAVHRGVPRSLGEFARREFWHGASSRAALFRQRITGLALLFLVGMTLGVGLLAAAAFASSSWLAAAGAFGVLGGAALAGLLAYRRFGPRAGLPIGLLLTAVQLSARGVAAARYLLFRRVVGRASTGRGRTARSDARGASGDR